MIGDDAVACGRDFAAQIVAIDVRFGRARVAHRHNGQINGPLFGRQLAVKVTGLQVCHGLFAGIRDAVHYTLLCQDNQRATPHTVADC